MHCCQTYLNVFSSWLFSYKYIKFQFVSFFINAEFSLQTISNPALGCVLPGLSIFVVQYPTAEQSSSNIHKNLHNQTKTTHPIMDILFSFITFFHKFTSINTECPLFMSVSSCLYYRLQIPVDIKIKDFFFFPSLY